MMSLIILCFVQVAILNNVVFGSNIVADVDNIIQSCSKKLNFQSIHEFDNFALSFKSLVENNQLQAHSNQHVQGCLAEKEAIFELHELVSNYDRKRACKLVNVERLENFARKHLLNNRKSLALKFFTLFSTNILVKCKINLMAHLKQADMEVDDTDFIYSMASPTGWNVLINELVKKSMKFGTSAHSSSNLIYRIANLIPGLTIVDQLDYMDFNHVRNHKRVEQEAGTYKIENPTTGPKLIESLTQIIDSCKSLDKFYVNSILSIAKLNELGITIDLLNNQHESSPTLHKWLAAASFCQLMVRVKVKLNDAKDAIDFDIIHDDNLLEDRRKLYSYVAEFDEISDEAISAVWQVSVPEGKWCRKNEAIFREKSEKSKAILRVEQYIKGLDRDFAKLDEVSYN